MVSPIFSVKALASILSVLSAANAHMIMKTPIPYGRGTINNSPLAADGSDFPCKNIFTLTDPTNDVNHMAIGEEQTLSFTGSATHGGGSCQVSLTSDLVPSKSSKWMVIKSIEGGCPAAAAGNIGSDANGSGAATFTYSVPQGVAEGAYTIAWTWVNKVGNREFYMNCGRAQISSSKKRYAPAVKPGVSKRDSFPAMFVANLAGVSNGCATTEGVDITYPDAGSDVTKAGNPGNYGPPTGCSGSQAEVSAGSGSGSGSTSAAASSAAATSGFAGGSGSPSTTSAAAAATSGSPSGGNPGVFASGAASSSGSGNTVVATATVVPVQASSAAATSAPAAATSAPASSSSGSASSSSSSGSVTAGTACSPEGQYACAADGKSFQRCASGVWSVSMAMSAGTSCTPGQSATLAMVAGGSRKRDVSPAAHRSPLYYRRHASFLDLEEAE